MPSQRTFVAIFALATWLSTAHAQPELQVAAEFSRTSHVTLAADDGDRAIAALKKLAEELGGRVIGELDRNRPVTLEIPNDRYAELSRRLSSIGVVRREQLSQKSVTPEIESALELAKRAKARQENLERIRKTARNTDETLTLESELDRATQDREAAERRVRELRRGTGTTLVDVTLELPAREAIADPSLPFPWLDELGLSHLYGNTDPARPLDLRGFIDGAFEIRTGYAPRARAFDGKKAYVAAAIPIRVLGEAEPVGLFGGMDLVLGGGYGFLYGFQLYLGAGVPIGESFVLGLDTGPGFDGMTGGVIPTGITVPIETYVSFEAIRFLGISAYFQSGWVFAAQERDDGSKHAPFGDELTTGIRLSLASHNGDGYTRHRVGLRVGFDYREMMGTEIYQFVIGFGGHDSDFSY
jgi:hypothetical protein